MAQLEALARIDCGLRQVGERDTLAKISDARGVILAGLVEAAFKEHAGHDGTSQFLSRRGSDGRSALVGESGDGLYVRSHRASFVARGLAVSGGTSENSVALTSWAI